MIRILLVVSACVAVFASNAWASEPIIIGAYLSMTGNVAAYGGMGWSGICIGKKMRSEVLGRPVDVRLVDTKSDKVESANAVSRLIEREKAVAVLGEMISGNTIAGAAIAENRGIPMISPTATNPIVTQHKKWISRVCFIDTDQGRVLAKLGLNQLKAKKAALIYDISQDYSVGLAVFFKREFTNGGGRIVSETMFKTGDRDFNPQLSTIKGSGADIICAPIYYTECALLAKQAKEMGITIPIVAGDGVQAPELLELGGGAVENIYFTTHFHKDMITSERGKKFLKIFEEDTGRTEPDAFTAMATDAYLILLDSIERAGSTDPDKIRAAILTTKDFDGVSGKITMKEDGNPVKAMVIDKVENNKFVYVTTINPD
ncbi:MAG TPA: ABC transporter substrate-binding protein [Desulfomonilaceae bacterium]|nr:ABC transporter substrate-binding protein [Desulfomonilaceae bacterium]